VRGPLLALLVGAVLFPSAAAASPVIVMTPGGQVVHRDDPYLSGPALTPAPLGAPAGRARATRGTDRTVRSELTRLRRSRAITADAYRAYNASFDAALTTEKRLTGTRAVELEAVIENLHQIAASAKLIPSRLPVLFQTLDRNRQWWTTGPLLASGQRVEFTGSALVWQYYPGQGIELQVLGTFGKADGLYTAGPGSYPQLVALLRQMIPLAARRGGGLTWEYYFKFDGGMPPWTSAMSQGTGLEALTRGYRATGDRSYLKVASRALPIFYRRPKVGVRERTPRGARYLQYSFAPGVDIINAFLQSLIGLYDYSTASADKAAKRLFAAGDAQAQAELAEFDTGAWSLYQPGDEDDLSYHELVIGFLHDLCTRTGAIAYCTTAQRFDDYLHVPPALTLLTHQVKLRAASTIRFRLSKISKVGIVVARGSQPAFDTSASFTHGVHSFAIPALSQRGQYQVRLAATDLAGNFGRFVGTIRVS
jgi:hypothetical protein